MKSPDSPDLEKAFALAVVHLAQTVVTETQRLKAKPQLTPADARMARDLSTAVAALSRRQALQPSAVELALRIVRPEKST